MNQDELYIFGPVTPSDKVRICELASTLGMTQGEFVRMCIADWLDDVSEKPLEPIREKLRMAKSTLRTRPTDQVDDANEGA